MTTQQQIADEIYHRGFYINDHFLDLEHYNALRTTVQLMHNDGYFKPAKIGHALSKTQNSSIRRDQILWMDNQEGKLAINGYFTALDTLSKTLNQSLFLGLVDCEAHFAVYPPNSFYKKHVDQFSTNQDRRISCVYYLNDTWEQSFGGELKLYDTSDQLLCNILPLGNRFVCFNSQMAHEVCTTYQTRFSIAAWLKIRPITWCCNSPPNNANIE